MKVKFSLSETERTETHTFVRQGNANARTLTPASLYETFPPAEARRILQRIEFHFTPSTTVG